ncbi:MAG: peptidoglycan bridge formation glycyltransferase FemA/FemB family protein [bacterium]|nr:peptidoglycan bridge formation glycyltransferase FemA/FemB family protein [bacterium]
MSKSILQTPFWAQFKAKSGWQQYNIADTSALIKKIFKDYSMAYIPEVSNKDWASWIPQFSKEIKLYTKSHKLIFTRLEILEPTERQDIQKELTANHYKKSFEFVQPDHRRIIDISGTNDEILAQMKPKGRYNIKVAEKHGVQVETHNDTANLDKDTDIAYSLIACTGGRKNFGVREKAYFKDLLSVLYDNDSGALFLAKYEGKPLAALIITYYDGVASYFYGGSSFEHKETMAPYLAHWEVIQEAKRRNCQTYDMLGAAPPDQPNHPYAGFARFKEQFGGSYVHLLGSFDLIFNPIYYKMFCLAQKRRRHGVI